ncbi:putative N-acetyltransferase Aca1p [[Candida] railenensis]|uniref:N-acetyltransferase Aca1p n=1 Tax=[Candida] railenensis TaxID=45579 RepID=A0A9P0QQ74_9ASCO|nr:putative N-acetyltransferase Aca1p [[Candida] railenensis]
MVSQEKYSELESLPFTKKETVGSKTFAPVVFTLEKDSSRTVTIIPVTSSDAVPRELIEVLREEFNFVVEEGRTYPYENSLNHEDFLKNWFSSFVAILLEGDYPEGFESAELKNQQLTQEEWTTRFLGNFYIKPNYAGRCSHVCNAGFIVNHVKRGLGLGKELGRKYLHYAPQIGYVYSVFNLVFETNPASMRIWDGLGFERIGYVKNVAVLKGEKNLVGAYLYGKDL